MEMSRKYRHVAWYSLFVAAYMVVLYLQVRLTFIAISSSLSVPRRYERDSNVFGGRLPEGLSARRWTCLACLLPQLAHTLLCSSCTYAQMWWQQDHLIITATAVAAQPAASVNLLLLFELRFATTGKCLQVWGGGGDPQKGVHARGWVHNHDVQVRLTAAARTKLQRRVSP